MVTRGLFVRFQPRMICALEFWFWFCLSLVSDLVGQSFVLTLGSVKLTAVTGIWWEGASIPETYSPCACVCGESTRYSFGFSQLY